MTTNQSSIEELVRKANKLGSDKVPENFDETVTTMLQVMKSSGKILTVKDVTSMFPDKSAKFWSDKMWNLAGGKKDNGVLRHLSKRGHYQYRQKKSE